MRRERIVTSIAFVVIVFLSSYLIGSIKEYTGTVTPIATSSMGMNGNAPQIYGNYAYIAQIGSIIVPGVTDTKTNKVVIPGTKLLQFDMRYWNAQVDYFLESVKDDKAKLAIDEKQMARYANLAKTRAVSLSDFETVATTYYTDLATYANDLQSLGQYQAQQSVYTDYAPVEGIVTNISGMLGMISGGSPAITITELNPIGVKVKMSRDEAKSIGNNTPVKIYPINSNTPQGVIYGRTFITSDGIEFVTQNYPVLEGTTPLPSDGTPIIRTWSPVQKFYIDKNPNVLAVPELGLQHDAKGTYVWIAKDQKTMQVDKPVAHIFQIKKVYVNVENLYRQTDNFERIVALKDNGSLQLYDLVMVNPPLGLKDGETVAYPDNCYLLMPGDPVKVVIGSN